ncbi:hypothetical protein [Cellulophaga sp. L1A9]|uniref:hypothetical protein n=1 Tax=Cellulophaga sp. L1A9 TaxID=2686362 RepID=UPI00131D4656|nr:hypothetical protein [Cellulophaga sp. L1A9]
MFEQIFSDHYLILYVVTIVTSILSYKNYFESTLRYLPVLLTYILLTEVLGLLIKLDPELNPFITGLYSDYNYIIYYVYNILFFSYFYYVYWNYTSSEKIKKIIAHGAALYFIIALVNAYFKSIISERQLFSYTYGSLLLIFLALNFIVENKRNPILFKRLLFWISLGLIIYEAIYFPINIVYSYITKENVALYYQIVPYHKAAVFALYGCFIIGFIVMKPKLK